MASIKQKIMPCLWFDTQAEDAAKFYTRYSRIRGSGTSAATAKRAARCTARKPGSVMVVEFEIDGQMFTALNGGPHFKFDEAISFQVMCDTPGRDRLLLEQAVRRRPGRPVRLAQGQIRSVLAGRAFRAAADDVRWRRRQARPHDERRHGDEEIRSGSAQARQRRVYGWSRNRWRRPAPAYCVQERK